MLGDEFYLARTTGEIGAFDPVSGVYSPEYQIAGLPSSLEAVASDGVRVFGGLANGLLVEFLSDLLQAPAEQPQRFADEPEIEEFGFGVLGRGGGQYGHHGARDPRTRAFEYGAWPRGVALPRGPGAAEAPGLTATEWYWLDSDIDSALGWCPPRLERYRPDFITPRRIPAMTDPNVRQRRLDFRALHDRDGGFLLPNPWDLGSARLLEALGFEALATTSQGAAAALGRRDGELTREEAIEHARVLNAATDLSLSADLENGFGDAPEAAADCVRMAVEAGLAGCSIEDYGAEAGLYDSALAIERVSAAVEVIPQDGAPLVLTARCENHLRGNPDLDDTIRRLQAYQEAGADVLYAPALTTLDDVRTVLGAIDRPLNVLLLPGGPSANELRALGVRRISVGSALAWAAYAGLADAARELLAGKSHDYYGSALANAELFQQAWGPRSG